MQKKSFSLLAQDALVMCNVFGFLVLLIAETTTLVTEHTVKSNARSVYTELGDTFAVFFELN